MSKTRLEAFSDGVIAILITIMVLELHQPAGATWHALRAELPVLLAYVLSFVYIGIYWNNHHHMLASVRHVSGGALWANQHLLFWLSLVPFTTQWMSGNDFAAVPVAVYGISLLTPAIAFYVLQTILVRAEGEHSVLATAIGRDLKGKLSPVLYVCGIAASVVDRWVGIAFYVVVALLWLVPDRRIERLIASDAPEPAGG